MGYKNPKKSKKTFRLHATNVQRLPKNCYDAARAGLCIVAMFALRARVTSRINLLSRQSRVSAVYYLRFLDSLKHQIGQVGSRLDLRNLELSFFALHGTNPYYPRSIRFSPLSVK